MKTGKPEPDDDNLSTHIRSGSPESFGWLRRKDLEKKSGGTAWELPDGSLTVLPPGVTEIVQALDPRQLPPPTDFHTRTVCRIGQGADCCRYLTMSPGGWSCQKLTGLKAELDRRVAAGTMVARGNNCPGLGAR